MSEWIACADRLPALHPWPTEPDWMESKPVLVYAYLYGTPEERRAQNLPESDTRDMVVMTLAQGQRSGRHWSDDRDLYLAPHAVTHWRELPELPSE